jgi:hypothetical protein
MATTWDTIMPLLYPELPGCPDATLKTALAATAADFCARTHIWRETLDVFYALPDIAEYDLEGSAVIEDIEWVTCNGQQLTHTDIRLISPQDVGKTGFPSHFWSVNGQTMRLFPIPDKKYTLKVYVALKPSRLATGIEDWIYETWADALVSGAIWRVARIPGKDWSNADLASAHRLIYEQGVTNARIRDFRSVPLRVDLSRAVRG